MHTPPTPPRPGSETGSLTVPARADRLQIGETREPQFPELDHEGALIVIDAASGLPADQNPFWVYLASVANGESRRAMAGCLNRIAGLWAIRLDLQSPATPGSCFPWSALRYQHTAVIRALILTQTTRDGQPWSPSYRNKHLTALRMVMRHAWLLGQMTAEDYHRAREIKSVRGVRLVPGRVITPDERQAMIERCLADATPLGLRDAALIATLYSTGCRREEIARATRDNYDASARALTVTGKGDKQRDTYLTDSAAAQLGRWLVAGKPRDPLFPAADRWGHIGVDHMTSNGVGRVIARRSRQAGVPDISAHDFRRTFTGDLLDRGVDLATVQQLLGHAHASTTANYDRRPAAIRRAAVDRLDQGV